MHVKVNAIIPEELREEIRELADAGDVTIQSVVKLAIELGLADIQAMSETTRAKHLARDKRKSK